MDQLEMRAGIDHTHLVGLSVFTTQTTHRRLQSVRDAIDRETFGPAPRLITTGLVAPLHGLRAAGAVDTTCTAPGTYRGPDSLPDMPDALSPLHFLGDLTNMLALRDNLYQL